MGCTSFQGFGLSIGTVVAGAVMLSAASIANAALVTYDDFSVDGAPDPARWDQLGSDGTLSVSGGVLTISGGPNGIGVQSDPTNPNGSFQNARVRFTLSDFNANEGFRLFGLADSVAPSSAAPNAILLRSDTSGNQNNFYVYIDSTASSPVSVATSPLVSSTGGDDFFDFVYTPTLVEIYANGALVYSTTDANVIPDIPLGAQAFAYGPGTLRVDSVEYEVVPEPASLALLGLPAAGLLLRRRRA